MLAKFIKKLLKRFVTYMSIFGLNRVRPAHLIIGLRLTPLTCVRLCVRACAEVCARMQRWVKFAIFRCDTSYDVLFIVR